VAAWRDTANGNKLRIFINSRYRLICLDAATGVPVDRSARVAPSIQAGAGLGDPEEALHDTSPPIVYKDLVILGNGVGDRLVYRNDPPGDIRAPRAHRKAGVDLPHDSAAGRTRERHLAAGFVELHRTYQCLGADDPRRRAQGWSSCRSAHRATISSAAAAGANLFAERSCVSTPTPARASGTTSWSITDCGTTTTRRRPTWSRFVSTAGPSTPLSS
jgi:hypothetical protein